MKTIFNSLIALLVLFMNSESFAESKTSNDEIISKTISYVPVSPRVWSSDKFETAEYLKFVKAKTALVPVAEFVWGNPEGDAPVELKSNLTTIPLPSMSWNENILETPESLRLVKAKLAKVPMPAKNWMFADISVEEIAQLK